MTDTYFLYELVFPNSKRYVGITNNMARRFADHCKMIGKSKMAVHHALKKYGIDNVIKRVLCVGRREYIAALEVKVIEAFQLRDRAHGYNTAPGGDVSPMHAASVAAQVSKTKLEQFQDPEYSRRVMGPAVQASLDHEVRARMLLKIRSPEVSAAKSLKLTGRKISDEALANMRRAQSDPVNRAKLSASVRAAWASPELRAAQSARLKGKVVTEEQKAKISAALMGHPGYGKGEKRPEISMMMYGSRWITDGLVNRRLYSGKRLPRGWRYGQKKRAIIIGDS